MMVLLVSLLEMNSSNLVINRIMRSLPLFILKKNLIQIFRRFKKMYNNVYLMDAFGHVNFNYYYIIFNFTIIILILIILVLKKT